MVKHFGKTLSWLLAAWLVVSIGLVLLYRFVPVKRTPLMVMRKVESMNRGERLTIRQQWIPLSEISHNLQAAVIGAEDANFYTHHGFDWNAIQSAWYSNRYYGEIVSGGSTISQQTAKNVFCTLHRTWLRKAFETYFTVLIELFWSKERILEVYLNVIEWGDGVFGAQAAALCHYGCSARSLTYTQSQSLANIIPNPHISCEECFVEQALYKNHRVTTSKTTLVIR